MAERPQRPAPERPPLIGLSADVKVLEDQPFHAAGEKYLVAVSDVAGALPVIVPALAERFEIDALLARLDGLLLTGSVSNVHPRLYGEPPTDEHAPFDPARDTLTFTLIERALAMGLPLLAICRGFQELNAALGGTLHPALHQLRGRLDHRAKGPDWEAKYGPKHAVTFSPGGCFHALSGAGEIQVNTLHRQGILTLAPRLNAEGHAPDGTVEAVSVSDARGFALGVQWHPEYRAGENPFSRRLFAAFGAAARDYAAGKPLRAAR